jgi:hypothetical protein
MWLHAAAASRPCATYLEHGGARPAAAAPGALGAGRAHMQGLLVHLLVQQRQLRRGCLLRTAGAIAWRRRQWSGQW